MDLAEGKDNKADYYVELLHRSLPLSDVMTYIMMNENAKETAKCMREAAGAGVIAL